MIKINQIKLPVDHNREALLHKIAQILKLKHWKQVYSKLTYSIEISRKSMDARKKPDLYYVYSVDIRIACEHTDLLKLEERIVQKAGSNQVQLLHQKPYVLPQKLISKDHERPVIIGSGPAGLFCAYILANAGLRPIILERGECVDERKRTVDQFWQGVQALNPDSNVQFGEGGAGTFSDGKLNTLVKDPSGRNRFVLETFVKFGADPEIIYLNKPHLGTDELSVIVKNMRNAVLSLGGEFHFKTCADQILIQDGQITGVRADRANREFITSHIVLAIGHSARDTFVLLQKSNVRMQAKSFAVGIRIEHPQEMINVCQYGKHSYKNLPAADYKLVHQTTCGRSVYSFCMCPGGYVVNASSEEKRLAINGMSYHNRDGNNANSALIASVTPKDFPSDDSLAGIAFQRRLEEAAYQVGSGMVPVQRYEDFVKGISRQVTEAELMPRIKGAFSGANLRDIFPEEINLAIIEAIEQFGSMMSGYNRPDAILSGVESRTSSPVRIDRDTSGQSNIRGLYPCGEGAGYAGGITSAAMDGIKTAELILEDYRNG